MNESGAGETSSGLGSASLAECLDRTETQPNTTSPATCASGEGNIGSSPHANPRHVMSPEPSQTLLRIHSMYKNPSVKYTKEETPPQCPRGKNSTLKRNQSLPVCEKERLNQVNQDISSRPSDVPKIYVMNELRSVQFVCEQLRARVDGIEDGADMSDLRESQDNLSTRIRRKRGHVGGESLGACRVRLNRCPAGLARLEDRMRTQDWYHDLSEQESSEETNQMVEGRPRPAAPRRMVMQARVF